MSVSKPEISITEAKLVVQGIPILSHVPCNILLTYIPSAGGAFLGGSSFENKSHHVFNLGLLE